MMPDGASDDGRSHPYSNDSMFIITRPSEVNEEGLYVVCIYSLRTGLSYIGTILGNFS